MTFHVKLLDNWTLFSSLLLSIISTFCLRWTGPFGYIFGSLVLLNKTDFIFGTGFRISILHFCVKRHESFLYPKRGLRIVCGVTRAACGRVVQGP